MKYIDADKLIAEIEKRIQICEECELDGYPDTTSSEATLKSLHYFITSLQQEQPSEDLEKAAKDYTDNSEDWFADADSFIAGAEWQKEQMMKNVFSCEVVGEKRDLRLIDSTERCLFDAERGDWLKIIIVKEEEK